MFNSCSPVTYSAIYVCIYLVHWWKIHQNYKISIDHLTYFVNTKNVKNGK